MDAGEVVKDKVMDEETLSALSPEWQGLHYGDRLVGPKTTPLPTG